MLGVLLNRDHLRAALARLVTRTRADVIPLCVDAGRLCLPFTPPIDSLVLGSRTLDPYAVVADLAYPIEQVPLPL